MAFDIDEQYDKIYRFCYLRVKHRETAEDITQETFLRYLERPQYHNTDKTLHLLYTIAGNLCTDFFREKTMCEIPEDTSSDEDIEENILSDISLNQMLGRLSADDREIILMRYINDVPINVIGRLYNMSRFSVNRRLKTILKTLKSRL